MSDPPPSAQTIWDTAYGQLQLQMPRETFDTWLRGTRLIAHEDGTYILGVPNIYAREWLEHRLKSIILRTLGQIARRSVEVRFILWAEQAAQPLHDAGPLLADLEPPQEAAPAFEPAHAGETGLNPRYTFEVYAPGPSNRLALAAARAVVEAPGTQFNPLLVHADVGLGKTHLLQAIGHACADAGLRVRFVPAETFTNDLVAAIRGRRMEAFRDKYRALDVLLIDDLQFIAGKDSTQEEFYHTFNALADGEGQIVAAASGPPGQLPRLDVRLVSRFEGGLGVEIEPPDFETRLAILGIKARLRGFDGRIPLEVLELIAEETPGSVRDLEGALNRLIAAAMLTGEVPGLRLAERAIEQIGRERPPEGHLALADLIAAAAEYYGVSPDALAGRDRSREVSAARQVVMYLAREVAGASLAEIGEALGGRNHSTVLYAIERVADLVAADSEVRRQVQALLRSLSAGQRLPVPQPRARRR